MPAAVSGANGGRCGRTRDGRVRTVTLVRGPAGPDHPSRRLRLPRVAYVMGGPAAMASWGIGRHDRVPAVPRQPSPEYTPRMLRCSSCGEENPERFRHCGYCGAALSSAPPARETRKTVTILFTDVSDSTTLGERLDPESLRDVMGRYFAR